jgi:hypothetical protein
MNATGKIDEAAYQKFVQKYAKHLKKCWAYLHPDEPISDAEALKRAEESCKMYEHQFRIYEKVN